MNTNLEIAIEKALIALKPHVRQIKKKKKVKGKVVDVVIEEIRTIPAVVGPFDRRVIAELVQAAIKYNSSLEQQRIDLPPTVADVAQVYAETVP